MLMHRLTFATPHGIHFTYKFRSHIMLHAVCNDIILFVSNIIVCDVMINYIYLKDMYVNRKLFILKDKP